MVSCIDLFAEANQQWGFCSLSEYVALGPSTHGDSRPEDGMPWMEGVQYSLDNIKKVVQDKKDKTLFHVIMPHRKSKKERSFSVQWVDGQWKMLGAMSVIGAGITPIRLINDLHEKEARDIFERRLAGEKINVKGPYSADTAFLKKNRKNIDVIIGMYHDQVLTPVKTLFEYDAINITLGLPFIRISPDHGPNQKMLGQNKSNPLSLVRAIEFLEKN